VRPKALTGSLVPLRSLAATLRAYTHHPPLRSAFGHGQFEQYQDQRTRITWARRTNPLSTAVSFGLVASLGGLDVLVLVDFRKERRAFPMAGRGIVTDQSESDAGRKWSDESAEGREQE
jgi:hypothetical protein